MVIHCETFMPSTPQGSSQAVQVHWNGSNGAFLWGTQQSSKTGGFSNLWAPRCPSHLNPPKIPAKIPASLNGLVVPILRVQTHLVELAFCLSRAQQDNFISIAHLVSLNPSGDRPMFYGNPMALKWHEHAQNLIDTRTHSTIFITYNIYIYIPYNNSIR